MGGRKKPEGDRLPSVRPELHEKPSSREALRRLVSILAKDDATARDINALAKKEGIEKLTAEARRLGLIDSKPPSISEFDRALFRQETYGEFPSYTEYESKPLRFEDLEEGMRKAKALDHGFLDDPSDARRVAPSRRHGKTAAMEEKRKSFIAGLSKITTTPTPFRSPGFFGRTTDSVRCMATRWEWARITSDYFLAFLSEHSPNFDAHDWGYLSSIGLGSALAATELVITDEEQQRRCEVNLSRMGNRLRDLFLKAVQEGADPFQPHDTSSWLKFLIEDEVEPLPREAFSIKSHTYNDYERIRLTYTPPVLGGAYIATDLTFDRATIRHMRGRLPDPDPRANLPQGPPEAMNDRDFASVFQNWIKNDE